MNAALQSAAAEFLQVTDTAYDECSAGISYLDRLIVGSPASLADMARAYLLVCLYAYWERFFRTAFGEYLRCFNLVHVQAHELDDKVHRVFLRGVLCRFFKEHNLNKLHELADRYSAVRARSELDGLVRKLDEPILYNPPSDWVETESNVRFRVLEQNCERFGIDLDAIKADFQGASSLFQQLEELVTDRNDIAHGGRFEPRSQAEWERTRNFVLKLIQTLQFELHRTLEGGHSLVGGHAPPADFQI